MYTQCPQCLTIFEIDEDVLQASLGIVRCGHCTQRFDALSTLSSTLPAEPDAALAERNPAQLIPTLTGTVSSSAFEQAATKQRRESATAQAAPVPESDPGESPAQSMAGEAQPAAPNQPLSIEPSDEPTGIEIEPGASPPAAATPAAEDTMADDDVWQTDSLTALDIPLAGEEPGAGEFDPAVEPNQEAPCKDAPLATTECAAANAAGPAAAVDPTESDLPPLAGEENIDTLVPGELAADELAPIGTESTSTESGVASLADPPPLKASAAPPPLATRQRMEIVSDPARPLAPVYIPPRKRMRTASAAWASGCLLLALILGAQIAWIERVALLQEPATRSWATSVCQVIACHLPPIRNLAKLTLLSRDIRPDPHAAGALMITATIRNNAAFRQPWPVIVVELTDVDNNPVAMRRFRPAEYMPDPARRATGIAPGATSAVAFEVADPDKRAVAFQFGFE